MDFDFLTTFNNLSNSELIEIVRFPQKRKEQALQAAYQVLNERGVSEAEIQNAIQQTLLEEKQNQSKQSIWKNKFAIDVNPLEVEWDFDEQQSSNETPIFDTAKLTFWTYGIVILPLFSTLFSLLLIIDFIKNNTLNDDLLLLSSISFYVLFIFVYILTVIGFWYKKTWAWLILVINAIYTIGLGCYNIVIINMYYENTDSLNWYDALIYDYIYIVLGIVSLYFMHKKQILLFHSISKKRKENAWLIGLAITCIYCFTLYLG